MGATPERPEGDKSKLPVKSRIARLREGAKDEDFEPDMPDPGDAAYLLAHFWRAGPTEGDRAITSGELRHYQTNMGIELSPWECEVLRRLSLDYLGESHRASKADCQPPFTESTDHRRIHAAEMRWKMDLFRKG